MAALLALALGLWLGRSSSRARVKEPPAAVAEPATLAHSGSTDPRTGFSGGVAAPKEELPVPPCWEGLLALDKGSSLDELYAALTAASDDPLLVEYLQTRLSEVIGDSSASALAVIGRAAQAGPPLTGLLLEAVKRAPAAQQGKVA